MMSEEQQALPKSYRRIEELIPPHWFEGKVLANGIHHHYYRTGGEKPALVLLHGVMMNGLSWMRVAKALEQDYDVIMVDARGHGRSDGIASGFSSELLTEDAAGVINALKLDKPSLLGHSMGGAIAAQVAATYPDLVRSILLEDPPWHDTPRMQIANSEGYKAWFNSWLAWLERFKTQTHEERLVSILPQLPPGAAGWPEEELVPWVEAYAQLDLDLARLGLSLWSVENTPWRDLVPRINCPILLMTGNPELSAVVTPQDAQEIAAAWRNGQLARFEHVGHLMQYGMDATSFDHFMAVVRAFLALRR